MKNKLITSLALFCFLVGTNILLAQSDYEIVQNFKERAHQIDQAISDADSLNALVQIEEDIEKLRDDFASHKQLLDKGLYPENFDNTIDKLENAYYRRNSDFTQIVVLETKVTALKDQLDTLDRQNKELADEFELLKQRSEDDKTQLTQLQNIVASLKSSLQKRDQVVMNMIDSLLPASMRANDLTPEEKQQVFAEAEENNILFHIKKAVSDNIRFLRATKLYPDDIEEIKDQQEDFSRIWKTVGPTMTELYAEKGKSTDELKEIDNAFSTWHSELYGETWESIKQEFAEKNIHLGEFSNGKEFTAAVSSYIDEQIKKADEKEEKNVEAAYENFADSTWYSGIKSDWMPFLIDNKLIAEAQDDSIEVMIASWKSSIYPGGTRWLYIVLSVLLIAVLIWFFSRKASRERAHATRTS
jgi:DNA repair ATPase RecN